MPRIRLVDVENFRCLKKLRWSPSPGINCLIGPGDSGKSTVLDAIYLCLGARRSVQFTDADFHQVQVETPIKIAVTLGELDDSLRSLDAYGLYLRAFHAGTQEIEDEPGNGGETVLTVLLTVSSDLEPEWTLYSERATEEGQARGLSWSDRTRLAPTRVDVLAGYHLTWRRGSVLNRLSDEQPDVAAALAKAGRDARLAFGDGAEAQLRETLSAVATSAAEMGIPTGASVRALIDPESVSFSGGTISVHNHEGVPLGAMGTGSARLLIAALQRKLAVQSSIVLVDELEHGLEPHRVIRLLGSLGAKEDPAPLQVFASTHSPVVLSELSSDQLFVFRSLIDRHTCTVIPSEASFQGTVRKFAEGFLSRSPLLCEGATEVGFVRGMDHYRVSQGKTSIMGLGVAPLDAGRGGELLSRAIAFQSLGYRTAILRDDDRPMDAAKEAAFRSGGGTILSWGSGRAIEDALFLGLPEIGVSRLLERAVVFNSEDLINQHIESASNGTHNLAICRTGSGPDVRAVLAKAAKANRRDERGWFKSVGRMAQVAHEIVGPLLHESDDWFRDSVERTFVWATGA